MKLHSTLISLSAIASAIAGPAPINLVGAHDNSSLATSDVFQSAIRPITAPTVADLAVPRTQLNLIYMNQSLSDQIRLSNGTTTALGGDFNLYALQFEYALNDRTSIVATKDGYIDFNPDSLLNNADGFANLAAGIKRVLIHDTENAFALSGIATVEVPTGNSDVWQGEGKGSANLTLSALKMYDRLQLSGNAGLHIPFSDSESFTGSINLHASYEISPWFIPVVELNWYHVFDAGDGSFGFNNQGGSLVPQNVSFEGGDLINFGASSSDQNRDIVTLGAGFRSRISENSTFGVAYEIPLTDEETNLMENRVTASLTYQF